MYTKTELQKAIFINIATKSITDYSLLSPTMRNNWDDRSIHRWPKTPAIETYQGYAETVAEYAQIVGFTIGAINVQNKIEIQTEEFDNEKDCLTALSTTLGNFVTDTLAGFNLANQLIPFVNKRMLINQVAIPFLLMVKNKKPWEINMIDVMRDYQGNGYDIDLNVMAETFNIKQPNSFGPIQVCENRLKTTMQLAQAMCY